MSLKPSTLDFSVTSVASSCRKLLLDVKLERHRQQELYLRRCHLFDDVVPNIVDVLSNNTRVTELNLFQNCLTGASCDLLGSFLAHPACRLTKLVLSGNNIGNDGASALFRGMCSNTTLTTLSLYACRLTDRCHGALTAMIAKQRSLRVLYVNGNEFSTAVEPSLLKALESNHRLTLLQYSGLSIDADSRVQRILARNRYFRDRLSVELVDFVLAFWPLNLPVYVLLVRAVWGASLSLIAAAKLKEIFNYTDYPATPDNDERRRMCGCIGDHAKVGAMIRAAQCLQAMR